MDIEAVPLQGCAEAPTKLLQVYVDDFCYAATQSKDGMHILTIRWAAIHEIQAVFPPPAVTNNKDGKDPISWKKLLQGNGHFQSKKDMIGFSFDGVKRTVHPPPVKAKAYIKEIHCILRWKSVPLKTLQGVVGKIRHASIILPAACGFFTPINAAMRGSSKSVGLGANSEVRVALEDMCTLLHLLSSRPMHVRELIPDMPHYVGYHDVAAAGAGGVWFSLTNNMPPSIWQAAFPPDIESEVVSNDNPDGRLTNSNLELLRKSLPSEWYLLQPQRSSISHWGRCVTTPQQSARSTRWPPRPRAPQRDASSGAWRSCYTATKRGGSPQYTSRVTTTSWPTLPHTRQRPRSYFVLQIFSLTKIPCLL